MAADIRPAGAGADPRLHLCRSLGISSLARAHEIILKGLQRGPHSLMLRGLNAHHLEQLGYSAEAMRRLGFADQTLIQLGFHVHPQAGQPASSVPPVGPSHGPVAPGQAAAPANPQNTSQTIAQAIQNGARSNDLKAAGYSVDRVKRLGLSASELARLGYDLPELISICSPMELRRADFNARELKRFFSADELRRAGCTADELRIAGCSVRELLNAGYNENQVRVAGFSVSDLIHEGLTKTTHT